MSLSKSSQPSKGLKVGMHHGAKLNEHLNKQMDKTFEEGKEKLGDVYNKAKRKTNKVYAVGKKTALKIPNKLKKQTKTVIKTLEKKPLTTLLVAGGIGLIMGLFMINKHK